MFRASWNRLHWWLHFYFLCCCCFAFVSRLTVFSHSVCTDKRSRLAKFQSQTFIENEWLVVALSLQISLSVNAPLRWIDSVDSSRLKWADLLRLVYSLFFCFCLHGLQPSVRDSILFLINWHLLVVQREGCINIYVYVCVWTGWLPAVHPENAALHMLTNSPWKSYLHRALLQEEECVCVCVYKYVSVSLNLSTPSHTHTHTLHALCHAHFRAACFVTMRTLGLAWALFADWCFECLNWK